MTEFTVPSSRKKCPIQVSDDPIFFSLADYRNNYFMSDDPNKIIEFYNGFENCDQLIRWMKERPKGVANIHEVDGVKDIIVVIPTADFEGKYANRCKDSIFNGLHIIFVESGEAPDPYFNFAHNCNIGIRKALEYKPKWIVVSNDDMKKVDDIKILQSGLTKLCSKEKSVIFCCTTGLYHSRLALISQKTYMRSFILLLKGRSDAKRMSLEEKYNIKYVVGTTRCPYRFIYKNNFPIKYTGSFAIFSIGLVKSYSGILYDETYINGTEDIDQSWRFRQDHVIERCVEYKIDDFIGGTIGPYNSIRRLRGIINDSYLNAKIESGELKFID